MPLSDQIVLIRAMNSRILFSCLGGIMPASGLAFSRDWDPA
jgi:hypothetical protein